MLGCSILLLLLCLVNHSETPSVEARYNSETGKKGGNFTLKCEQENNTIINLIRRSKSILDCQNGKCENKTENVQGICKDGVCDIIIKNLSFSDAGIYILRFSHANDQTEMQEKTYRLQIQDEVCVNIGEKLKLDVLSNADKVEHQNKISTEWTEVWNRSDGVQRERLTDTDGKLSINNVTASDLGSYTVRDSEGAILITVTVTEYKTESKEGQDGTEQHAVKKSIAPLCSILLLVVIVIVITVKATLAQRLDTGASTEESRSPEPVMMLTECDKLHMGPEHLEAALVTCNLPSAPTGLSTFCHHDTSASEQEQGTQLLPRGPSPINCTGAQTT